jgi:dTDP-4-dehydrorhamnose reductase
MTKVLIIGSTGMLGSAVTEELRSTGLKYEVASRSEGHKFDAVSGDISWLTAQAGLESGDFIVNCIGLTKARIQERDTKSLAMAVELNVNFPMRLAKLAEESGFRVIQVATDCVFSGRMGNYSEDVKHDPLDVYGKTKSLGEIASDSVMHLRCSLIGPERGRRSLFFEWVRQQPRNARIYGYINHLWNGLSSKAFGRIVAGTISHNLFSAGVQHLVPEGRVTKDELVRMELAALGRLDVRVQAVEAEESVDRTLATNSPDRNLALFAVGGYEKVPTIAQMVEEICSELPN